MSCDTESITLENRWKRRLLAEGESGRHPNAFPPPFRILTPISTPRPGRQPSVRHTIEAWRGGTSTTVTWDDQYIGPALSREMEGIRLVIAQLHRVLQENDAVRLPGPPVTNMCRAPL